MKFSQILIYLLPLALVTGPLIPEIIIIIISLNIIIISFLKKNLDLFKNEFSIFFLIFYILINISSIFSENILISLQTSLPYCRYYFFVIGIVYLIKNEKKFISNLFYSLLFTMIIVSLSGYLEFFFDFNPLIEKKIVQHRISGLFGDELIIGSFLSRLLPLLLICYVFIKDEKINKNIIFLTFLFIYLCIVFSGERTSVFFSIITIFTIIVIFGENIFKKIVLFFIFFSFTIALIFSNQILFDRIFKETNNQIFENKKINIFSKEHTSHYQTAYKMFLDNPILGHGPKSFRIICNDKKYYKNIHSCTTHPHNTYLQLLAETGLISTLMVFFIFILNSFFYTKYLFKSIKNINQISFYLPFIITLFPFVPNGNFFNNWLSIVSYLSVSVSVYFIFYKKNFNV